MTASERTLTRAENFRRYLAHRLVEQHGAEPDLAPTIANMLANSTTFDEDGRVVVRDRFGMPTDTDLDDLVAEFRAIPGNSGFFVKAPHTEPADTRPRILATVGGVISLKSKANRPAR